MAGPWEAYQEQPETPSAPAGKPWLAYQEQPEKPTLMQRIAALPPARVPEWVPLIGGWQPSASGMVKGAAEQVKSATTLPGDVYAGRVDPMSDEGIRRSFEMGSTIAMPAPRQISLAKRPTPLPTAEIKAAASQGYQAATRDARAIPISSDAASAIADNVRNAIEAAAGPRPARAGAAHAEIEAITKAKDLGDILDARQNLRDMLPKGGPDQAAAVIALKEIDTGLAQGAPHIMPQVLEADANWSSAMTARTAEKAVAKAEKGGGRGRPLGTRLQETFRPLSQEPPIGLKPLEQEAMGRVAQPGFGIGALRTGAAFDPFTSTIGPILSGIGAFHNPWTLATMPAGYVSRLVYDRAMKNRAREVAELIRSRAPASMAVTGNQPTLRTLPAPIGAAPFALPALQGDYP